MKNKLNTYNEIYINITLMNKKVEQLEKIVAKIKDLQKERKRLDSAIRLTEWRKKKKQNEI